METKKLYNMNYLKGLHPKGSNELRMRTTKNGLRGLMLRSMALLLLLLGASLSAMGQAYVIVHDDYYLKHGTDGHSVETTASTGFDPRSCIWYVNNRTIKTANESGTAFSGNYFLQTGSVSLGNSTNWNTAPSNGANLRATTINYLRRNNTTWQITYTNSNRATAYTVSINPNLLVDNTIDPIISITSANNNQIQLSHSDLTGSYIPANTYTIYTYNSTNTHNWYNNTDYGTDVPDGASVNANTLNPTYTWSLTANGGGVASINASNGVLTLDGAPTGNITVRLTVSNISPIANKTVDFTLTHTHYNENVSTVTTMSAVTLTPTSKTMEYGDDQEFTASATVTTTTTTTQAYDRLQNGDNTYYYYGGALHNSTPTPEEEVTHPDPTYSWTLTGAGAGLLSLSSPSGSSTTVTFSSGAAANSSATLTVTASTPGASDKTNSAAITINRTMPTAISSTTTELTLCVGTNTPITYLLAPMGCYNNVTVTSSNSSVATGSTPNTDGTVTVTAGSTTGTATLTLTAAAGVTCALTVTVQDYTTTPTITFNNSNNQVTIASADADHIYYTTDGSTPTEASDEYTEPFVQSSPATLKAIATKDDYCPSEVASYNLEQVATPTIEISGTSVTFDGAGPSASYYYTTNGDEPTTALTAWDGSAITGITDGATIKVIAAEAGKIASPTVTKTYHPGSGISGTIVNINDLEDHNWSYYKTSEELPTGYPAELHSPDPRNIKITYKGNGQLTDGTAVTGVKVGVDASVDQFVYFKTLEKGTDGKYAYTTIPNPFSVRPTTGTGNSMVYYGFSHWKVTSISGGTIDGNPTTINAETEIKFNVTRDYTTNCQSIEVVMEAVWDVAEVSTNGTFTNNYGVERMFYVVPGGNANISAVNKACTYSSFYPNGTTNGTTGATLSNRKTHYGGFTATADSKIEYVILRNNNSTINAAGFNFTIGRGVSGYNSGVCATTLNGLSATQTTNFKLRIESGTYTDFYFMGSQSMTSGLLTATLGCDYDRANNKDNTKLRITHDICASNGGTIGANGSIGTEIFRCTVKSGNFDLGVYGGGYQFYISSPGGQAYGKRTLIVEGGYFSDIAGGIDRNGNNNLANINSTLVDIRIKGGESVGAVFGAAQRSASYGDRRIVITGGQFSGWIAGGANGTDNSGGQMGGASYVYVGGTARVDSDSSTTRINRAVGGNVFAAGCGYGDGSSSGQVKVGTNIAIADDAYIERGVYGGGSFGYTTTYSNIYLMGGTIDCIGGGINANGTAYSATVKGGIYGGACQNQAGQTNVYVYGGTVNGGVYGGGNVSGDVAGPINVDVYGTDPAPAGGYAIGQVYGGGNQADFSGTPRVTVHCGDPISIGDVYGGGNAATVTGTNVAIYGGNVIGNVYAGANAANVNGAALANIYGGTLGRVFAGNNYSGNITGGATVNINSSTETDYDHCPLQVGAVFHGGNQAPSAQQTVNIICTGDATEGIDTLFGGANAANITSNVTLNVTKGNIRHAIFGGNNAANSINGNITVTLGTDASCQFPFPTVFGGGFGANTSSTGNVTVTVGDKAGTQQPTVNGDIYGGSALGSVNDAAADNTIVNIYNGTVNGNVYGGGLGEVGDASKGTVNGVVTVNIGASDQTDGNCHSDLSNCSVYGCNNTNGSPQQNVTVNIYRTGHTAKNLASYHDDADSTFAIDQVFGGGNQADFTPSGKTATVHIYGCNNTIRRVFGGGNAAAASGVVTTIEGGRFGWVFGGGNGEVTAANIGAGGTNLTVKAGRIEHLFGASNANGTITGNMVTNVNHSNDGCEELIREFFGGANLAPINTNLSTTIACGTIFDKVYGGSKKAAITGNVTLTVNGGTINELYGGSEGTAVDAANINGDVTLNIYAGAIGKAFGGCNVNGNITGTATVNLDWSQSDCAGKSIDYIYGASNLATYTPSPKPEFSPVVNLINGTVNYSVFGAGKGADDVQAAGKVTSNPKVNMSGASAWVKKNVYGGGEMATVDGNTYVNISNGIVGPDDLDPVDIDGHGDVFGGGLGKAGANYSTFAFVTNANVTLSGGTVRGSVFGGGENGHVSNNTSVEVSGGVVGVRIPYAYRNISSDAGSSNPVYAGNVYGGGRGVDHTANGTSFSETAGRVYGNTSVSVSGGQIHHSVYGGGSLASVGTYTLTPANNIYGGHLHNFTNGTGNATVSISGGRIGPTWDELLLDDAGNSLVDANGDALNAAAATTIAHNYECLGENEGMVYGSGRGVNYTNDGNEDHQLYVEMAFTNNTTVTISGTADVVGSVFGGGENGHVKGKTQVNIQGGTIGGIPLHHKGIDLPGHSEGHGHIDDDDDNDDELGYNETGIGRSVFRGNVYGGGRGIDHTAGDATTTDAHIFSVSAGRVYGNTEVNVTGGRIYHNVFGGGSIASVGTYSYPSDGNGGYDFFTDPEAATSNTGKTTVNISGGQIGVMGENEGYVYGGGRGIAGTNETQVSHLAFVNETEVNISQTNSTHADVRASVFGGGMNGHVLTNTLVEVSGGVIGGKTAANYGSGAESYDPDIFTAVPGTVDYTIHGINYYSGIRPGDTITTSEGLGPATVFLGNVYGGGRGVDVTTGANLSYTAGRVYGNTAVNITGGVIYHSVFGGGSIASVGTYTTYTADEAAADAGQSERYDLVANQPKTCTSGGDAVVTITGGRIGTNGRNNGRVFGSSRGMAGTSYRGLGYVNRAHVVIGTTSGNTSTPEIRGSVFGSGENGHVLDSTLVEVKSGHIGNGIRTDYLYLNKYIGNVYGGGRGLDRSDPLSANSVSPFAGRVYRNTYVSVTGGQIDNNVYGGGSLASVGRYKRNANNEITFADADKGTARVNISGGTIGIDGDENGHVFGASRGTSVAYRERNNDSRARLAYVADSRVIVSGGTIKGSVFGGGESGHVQRDARVTVSGGEIGSTIPSDYNDMNAANKRKYDLMGNVYGAGRGIDEAHSGDNAGYSMSAGYVRGRTIVTITNTNTPIIHRNVYGGGSMGTVGDYGPYCRLDFWQGDPTSFARGTAANNYTDASNGVATVVIKGTVGTSTDVARNYGGNVYGSCRGQANDPTHDSELDLFYTEDGGFGEMAYVTGSHVIVETGANVWGNVYGGGENGHVDFGGTTVDILNGTVSGNVFGGGKGTSTSPTAGIIDGPTEVNIGSASQTSEIDAYGSHNTVVIGGDVFAGNDSYSSPLGTMTVNVYHTKHTAANKYPTLSDPVVASDTAGNSTASKYALHGVYGGGNLADVLTGIAAVDASDGNASHVYDQRYITQRIEQSDNTVPNAMKPWPGGISRKSVVNIYNCDENTIMYVFGGGRAAKTIEDEVNIYGGRIYQAYAGGDGSSAPAYVGYVDGGSLRAITGNANHGNATINVTGGIVHQVFGGCNTQGEVYGVSDVEFQEGDDCDIINSEVFGGNNRADMHGNKVVTIECGTKWNDIYGGSNEAHMYGNVTLNIYGGVMNRAFGGAKSADIDGDVTVNVYGGHIGEVFGGNNVSGNIKGTITVNVDIDPDYSCADGLALTTVYGGGRDAAYNPFDCFRYSPKVNIKHTSTLQISEVFGGGYGATAQTVSYPRVIVGGFGDGKVARVYNNIYGGGYGAPVYGNTVALVRSSVIGNDAGTAGTVFGGGFGTTAVIHGETYVGVFGTSDIKQNVYGGGNAGAVLGSTDVQVAYEEQLLPPETRAVMDEGTVYATFDGYPGASIRYTLDGTEPTTTTGNEYNGTRFPIDFENNIQAIAYKDGMIPSVVSFNQTPTPSITIDGASATLDGYPGSKLYYTTDGTEPTTSSNLYGGAAVDETGYNPAATISVTANSVIKVLAVMRGCANSHVAYLQAPQPEISSDGANYTITAPAGARIIYTTFTSTPTGSNPTSAMGGGIEHGTKVSEANDDDDDDTSVKKTITLTDGETLKAIVELDGYMPSIISAVKYTAAP